MTESTHSDTGDEKAFAQMQQKLKGQDKPSFCHRFSQQSDKQVKTEKRETAVKLTEHISIQTRHLYAFAIIVFVKFMSLFVYLLYQGRSITILMHELRRIGDGTNYILDKMNYL